MRLQDRLIAANICIDCQLERAERWVRCPPCHERHKRLQRERYRQQRQASHKPSHPTSKRNVMRRHKIRSYVTAKERGIIS